MLKERICILLDASLITLETSNYVNMVIDRIEDNFPQKEEILEMFITHLAMATQRILDHKDLEVLPSSIWGEITASENYEKADKMYRELVVSSPCAFPESEKQFLMMHLCNLV